MRLVVAIVASLVLFSGSARSQIQNPMSAPWPPPDPTPTSPIERNAQFIPDIERPVPPQSPDLAWINPPDNHRLWFTADYLLWWVKSASVPQPLVTLGSAHDPLPGALGQPHTSVFFGQNSVGFGPASGFRLSGGGWFDPQHLWGLEVDGFLLAPKDRRRLFDTDDFSGAAIAQPVVFPGRGEGAYAASLDGLSIGRIMASTSTQFGGWEVNGLRNLIRDDNFEFNLLGGFRQAILRESLNVDSDTMALQPNVLSFVGQPLNVGDQLYIEDRFHASTNFYGPQIGGKVSWNYNRFGVDFVGKVALGVSHEEVSINGATWLLPAANNSMTVVPGGILAQSSNIGRYSRDVFAVVPEANFNLHYDLTCWARLSLGYSFIYLSNAARPGLVVDRNVDPGRVPSDPLFGHGTSSNSPSFHFSDSGFWAQGLNLGITFRY